MEDDMQIRKICSWSCVNAMKKNKMGEEMEEIGREFCCSLSR